MPKKKQTAAELFTDLDKLQICAEHERRLLSRWCNILRRKGFPETELPSNKREMASLVGVPPDDWSKGLSDYKLEYLVTQFAQRWSVKSLELIPRDDHPHQGQKQRGRRMNKRTVRVIADLRAGKDEAEICLKHDISVNNLRQIKCRYKDQISADSSQLPDL